jgi:hypothetical protein
VIRKSIVTAVILMLAYHLVLPHLPRRFYQILGQQRSNYLRAQRYIYDVPERTNVIVGSSMSERLNDAMLGPNYYKLTLPGGSLFTAFEIIQRSRKKPPVVLIETNVITRDADEELLHDLFSPLLFHLRGASPIFKEEGRPANFVGGLAESAVRKTCQWSDRLLRIEPNAGKAGDLPEELRKKVIDAEKKGWSTIPDPEKLAAETARLGQYVDELTKQGTVCILFEMPVDTALSTLPGPVVVRQALNDRFPKDKYRWMSFDERNYRTRDGIHLIVEEADKLTQLIVDYLSKVEPGSRQADARQQPHSRLH